MSRLTKALNEVTMYAWVGPNDAPGATDEAIGIKQGIVPAGCIPLVAIDKEKITRPQLRTQLQQLTRQTGKPRFLVKLAVVEVIEEL